jgi:polar amino acid transport system substrate-binding protein
MRKLRFLTLLTLFNLLFSLPGSAQNLSIYCEDAAHFKGPDGKITGLDIEIVSEIQRRVGNTDEIQLVPWTRGMKFLDAEPNTILFSMARTKERNDLYQWIGPISETSYGFYTKADSPIVIKNLDDARKVTSIGVYRNDVRDQFLTKEGFTNLERANDNFSNLKKLMAGRVAVIAGTSVGIAVEAQRAGFSVKDVKFLYAFARYPIYIAASKKTSADIVASWNAALDTMRKDGTLKAIFKRYLPDEDVPGPELTIY